MNNNIVLKTIGKKIRELRISKGFTQESFAHNANLERAFYGKVESQGKNLTTINLIKIAKTLEVEVGDLFPLMSEICNLDSK